jgi:hypothetical protein
MLKSSFTRTLNHFVVHPLAVRTSAPVSPEMSVSCCAAPQSLGASQLLPTPPELLLVDELDELLEELLVLLLEDELLEEELLVLLLDELLGAPPVLPPVPSCPPVPPRALKPVSGEAPPPQAITAPSTNRGSPRRTRMARA